MHQEKQTGKTQRTFILLLLQHTFKHGLHFRHIAKPRVGFGTFHKTIEFGTRGGNGNLLHVKVGFVCIVKVVAAVAANRRK